MTELREPYISLTAWATPYSLNERKHAGKQPAAHVHLVIPHGKGSRSVMVEVSFDQCLALCANAADAARLLAAGSARSAGGR